MAKDCGQNISTLDPRNHLTFNLEVTRERERKKLPAKSNSTSNPPITLDNDGDISTDDEEMWIESLQLFERDKRINTWAMAEFIHRRYSTANFSNTIQEHFWIPKCRMWIGNDLCS